LPNRSSLLNVERNAADSAEVGARITKKVKVEISNAAASVAASPAQRDSDHLMNGFKILVLRITSNTNSRYSFSGFI
jgi:hypothetical protein